MLQDIQAGIINMVVTKDLSRLGRDYIQVGNFLEKFFPENKIRYVAVNDSVDTFQNNNTNNDMSPIKAVFNDFYAKDTSKKVRSALKTKQQLGSYIGTVAPYGYIKDIEKKGKLKIDPISSVYVKRIFEDFLNGKSINKIKDSLSIEKIPTPSEYRNIKNTQKYNVGIWNTITIRRILLNEVYIGHTIQNKKSTISYKVRKQFDIPKSEWIKVENTHDALINIEDFNKIQDILNKRSYIPKKGKIHLLTGLIFCGNCNAPVTFVKRYEKDKYYCLCSIRKNNKQLNLCDSKTLKEEDVIECIKNTLKSLCIQYVNNKDIVTSAVKKALSGKLHLKELEKANIERKLNESHKLQFLLYKDKVANLIDENTFLSLTKELNNEKDSLVIRLNELNEDIQKLSCNNNSSEIIEETIKYFLQFNNLDRNTLIHLIDKIVVNKDNTLDIYCKFNKN